MTDLEWLNLQNNQLNGSIPMELGGLSNLKRLYLHYNRLSGAIPSELGNLSELTNLWLKSNQLSGDIPPELGNLQNLERVRIGRNPGLTTGMRTGSPDGFRWHRQRRRVARPADLHESLNGSSSYIHQYTRRTLGKPTPKCAITPRNSSFPRTRESRGGKWSAA